MSIRDHFNEIETTRDSAIFSCLESQKRVERWLQNEFFVFLPSPKKYKIQLVSPFKSRENLLLHMKASVKSIFRQNIIKYWKNDFQNLILTLKNYKYAKNSKNIFTFTFYLLWEQQWAFAVQTCGGDCGQSSTSFRFSSVSGKRRSP